MTAVAFGKEIASLNTQLSTNSEHSCTTIRLLMSVSPMNRILTVPDAFRPSNIICFALHLRYTSAFPNFLKDKLLSANIPFWFDNIEEQGYGSRDVSVPSMRMVSFHCACVVAKAIVLQAVFKLLPLPQEGKSLPYRRDTITTLQTTTARNKVIIKHL